MCLVEHAQHVIQELARTRDPDGRIPAIDSVVLLERLRLHRQAGVLLGQVVALLDASCLTQDLPWLGRVIIFRNPGDDWRGAWESWRPYVPYLLRAPLLHHWTDPDLECIERSLLPTGPEAWWNKQAERSAYWLQRAVLVTLREAYDNPGAP